jgi:DNA invertase Pin-like site-specific DNA recombinase
MVADRPCAYSYIRMSQDTQLKGDSLRRQRDACQKYAARHGLELVDDFAMEDIGLSGWTGANIESGNFGRFLEAVRRGEVEKGSYLLVEAFDRISRQPPLQALQPFLDLINNGIVLVTLDDEKQFTHETMTFEDLIVSIAKMSRANDESVRKSDRVSKAWKNKRQNAHQIKLTKRCPAWLSLSADNRTFSVIQERAQVVRRIFNETVSGIGAYSVARRLNAEKVPTFGNSNGWRESSLHKIITSRAVIGEFQPHRRVNGKRVPDGDPIPGYFPAIIEQDLFFSAQKLRIDRRDAGGGRTGKRISNLFSKLAVCRECGGRMHFENKGMPPKGGTYLVCDTARRNLGCWLVRWKYNDFEASFLAFVAELDLGALLTTEAEGKKRTQLDQQISSLNGQLALVEEDRAAAFELHKRGVSMDFIAQKLADCDAKSAGLKSSLAELRAQLAHNTEAIQRYYESTDQLQDLIERLRDRNADEVFKQRALVSARLRTLIEKIVVCPEPYRTYTGDKGEIGDLANFEVCFRNGMSRIVYPHPDDPLRFVQQTVGNGGKANTIDPDGKQRPMDDGWEEEIA